MSKFKCLLCFEKFPQEHVTFVTSPEKASDFELKIYNCSQININYQRFVPFALCHNCGVELNIAVTFREKCLSVLDKFQSELISEKVVFTNHKLSSADVQQFVGVPISTNCKEELFEDDNHEVGDDQDYEKSMVEQKINDDDIKLHKLEKILKVPKIFICSVCLYSTKTKRTFENHIRKHNGERPFKCECGKSFTQQSSLSSHKSTHSDARKYICSTCDKPFKLRNALIRHLKNHEKPSYSCKICFKKLKSKETLKSHLDRHANILNYNCEVCGERFVTTSELCNHKKKHMVLAAIECDVCGFKTISKKILRVHIIRHSGIKSHQCKLCHYACYTSSELKAHHRVHTQEKPYQCSICKQKFMHSSGVHRHTRAVHGSKLQPLKKLIKKGMKLKYNTDL